MHLISTFFKLQNVKEIWHIIWLVRALIVCTPMDTVIILHLCHCYSSLIPLILNCLDRYEGASLEEDTLHHTPLPAWWKVSVWFYSKRCFLPFCILGSWFTCLCIALQTLSNHTLFATCNFKCFGKFLIGSEICSYEDWGVDELIVEDSWKRQVGGDWSDFIYAWRMLSVYITNC